MVMANADVSPLSGVDSKQKSANSSWVRGQAVAAEDQLTIDTTQDFNIVATRQQVVEQALEAQGIVPSGGNQSSFEDVAPDSPFATQIETAKTLGVISSNSTNFRPRDPINRAEMVKILAKAFETSKKN